MKNSEQLDSWMSRLGQRKSLRVREDFLAELNAAIVDLENKPFQPWFLQQRADLDFASGEASVQLPTGFSLEAEGYRPYYVLEGTIYYLTKKIPGKIFGVETTATRPKNYALIGDYIEIRPIPTQAYTIYMYYMMKTGGGVLDNQQDVDNVWLLNAAELVCAKAASMVAGFHLQNQQLAADFVALERQKWNELYRKHEARQHTNSDYQMGGVSDGS